MGVKYVDNFSFPSDFGFTGSSGRISVRPHSRAPRGYAEGGLVDKIRGELGSQYTEKEAKELHKQPEFIKKVLGSQYTEREARTLRKSPVTKAMGGPVKARKGGRARGRFRD